MKTSDRISAEAAAWIARRDAGFSREDEHAFERWRECDPRHESALAAYDAAWHLLGTPAQHGHGEEMQNLLAGSARRRTRRRAATVVAALAIVGFFFVALPREEISSTALMLAPEKRVLADGSIVELKEGARIEEHFTDGMRAVRLDSGEAHFDVRPDPARPFVVTSAGVSVRAVGTAFAVNLVQDDSIEVVVSHGVVAVDSAPEPDQAEAPPTLTLDEGKMARIKRASPSRLAEVRILDATELAERLGWRSPRIEFTKATLEEAAALFNRHRPSGAAVLTVNDPAIRTMPVTGVFRADNSEAFVSLLEKAFGLKVTRSDTAIVIGSLPSP